MLRWVGVQPGWRVLDAGSGPGSFLPLMSELVGPGGHIDAMDLAPENVATLKDRAVAEAWQAPVTARTGSVVDLPYDDNSFDAVWCANVTQYLTDDALRTALREFGRVVRPGGLVAIKDYDATVQQYHPTPLFLQQHFQEAVLAQNAPAGSAYTRQVLRVVELPRWLRDAGLSEIRQKPTFMLRLQPLSPEGSNSSQQASATLPRSLRNMNCLLANMTFGVGFVTLIRLITFLIIQIFNIAACRRCLSAPCLVEIVISAHVEIYALPLRRAPAVPGDGCRTNTALVDARLRVGDARR